MLFCIGHSFTASAQSLQKDENINNFPKLKDPNLKVEQIIKGLFMPTSIAFIDNNDFLVTQKNGTVNRVINNTLVDKPLLNLNVASGFYQGLLGSAVSKDSRTNTTYVFLSFIEANNKSPLNNTNISDSNIEKFGHKIYRFELVGNKLTNPKLLLQLPSIPGPENNGGYITIGPDKNLYTIIGNALNPANETTVQTLAQNFINGSIPDGRSGILRITQDGLSVKDGNGNEDSIIGKGYPLNLYYAYGIHNGFGLDFDPISGQLWDAETGHNEYNDEINLVIPGFNSGFGVIQGMSKFFPNVPFELANFNGSGKYSDPEFTWMQKAVPTGLKFLASDKLGKKYKNDLFVGTFNAGKIYHFNLTEDRTQLILPQSLQSKILLTLNSTGSDSIEFGQNFGGISGLNVGPDGYLYVVGVINGAIYKITNKN
ncbi:MAG: PQQ-dependent sugar dehydrogenase [Candidatus Nitrosocosmicus sp.]